MWLKTNNQHLGWLLTMQRKRHLWAHDHWGRLYSPREEQHTTLQAESSLSREGRTCNCLPLPPPQIRENAQSYCATANDASHVKKTRAGPQVKSTKCFREGRKDYEKGRTDFVMAWAKKPSLKALWITVWWAAFSPQLISLFLTMGTAQRTSPADIRKLS